MSFLARFDYLGKDFKFNFEGGNFKTNLGGVITLLIWISYVVLTWYFGRDIYLKESPFQIKNESNFLKHPRINLKKQDFILAINIEDDWNNIYDKIEDFEFGFSITKYKINDKGIASLTGKIDKNLEKCSTKHVSNEELKHERFNKYFCYLSDHSFGGSWQENEILLPSFWVKRCDQETEKKFEIKCNKGIFKSKNLFITYLLQKKLFMPSNFTYPVQNSYHYKFKPLQQLDTDKVIRMRITYAKSKVITDDGLVFQNHKEKDIIEYIDTQTETINSNASTGKVSASIQLYVTRFNRVYERHYIKIPDLIANVGGFIGMFIEIITFFYSFYLDHMYSLHLYNILFDMVILEEDQKNQEIMNIELKSPKHVEAIYQSSRIREDVNSQKDDKYIKDFNNKDVSSFNFFDQKTVSPSVNNKRKSYVKSKEKIQENFNKDINKAITGKKIGEKSKKVEIRSCEKISFCNFKLEKSTKEETKLKYELMLEADTQIDQLSEITELWKIIDQVNLISKIVLNEEQCFMLKNRGFYTLKNSISKSTENNEREIKELNREKYESKKAKLIEYLRVKRLNGPSKVDELLFEYLSEELKEEIRTSLR